MTELLFLGTGPADPIPRPGHDDPLCADARKTGSKSRRLRSAALFSKGETRVLFDAGPDIGYQLASNRIHALDAAFLTHPHGDAAGGLASLDAWARERGVRLPVYTEKATERRYGSFPNLAYRFKRPGERAQIGLVRATFFRVTHSAKSGFPTFGFRIGAFAYASDVAALPKTALETLSGVCVLVLDAAFWPGQTHRGHLTADKSIAYGRKLGVRCLVLTQTGHTYPPHDEAERLLRRHAAEHAPGMDLVLSYDGLRLSMK